MRVDLTIPSEKAAELSLLAHGGTAHLQRVVDEDETFPKDDGV